MYEYSVAQQSHQGGRDYNEDRTAIFERDDALLMVVADGLGGHAGGDIASQAFVDAMGSSFESASPEQLKKGANFLTLSINYAHHMIHRRAVAAGFDVASPKTTCVVCLIYDGVALWAHSGDSRLYLIRKRQIQLRTEDHVSNKVSASGSRPINRCVGGLEAPKPEISEPHQLETGDIFVLASDGAWASFRPEDLRDYVDAEHPTLGLDSLLQELETRNKTPSDNLSIVVMFWGIEQLDKPNISDTVPQKVELLKTQELNPESIAPLAKFDMKDLDSTITDIERFITELDEKL
jgi:serine/threonine protein phosphatase PrpC